MINMRGKGTMAGLCTGILLLLMAAFCTGRRGGATHTVVIVDTVAVADSAAHDTASASKTAPKNKKPKERMPQKAVRGRQYLDEAVSRRSSDAARDDRN